MRLVFSVNSLKHFLWITYLVAEHLYNRLLVQSVTFSSFCHVCKTRAVSSYLLNSKRSLVKLIFFFTFQYFQIMFRTLFIKYYDNDASTRSMQFRFHLEGWSLSEILRGIIISDVSKVGCGDVEERV